MVGVGHGQTTRASRCPAGNCARTPQRVEGHGSRPGGADDPLLAFEDVIREFTPDHILVALRAPDQAGWQERGLLDQLLERFRLPVTAFMLPSS